MLVIKGWLTWRECGVNKQRNQESHGTALDETVKNQNTVGAVSGLSVTRAIRDIDETLVHNLCRLLNQFLFVQSAAVTVHEFNRNSIIPVFLISMTMCDGI